MKKPGEKLHRYYDGTYCVLPEFLDSDGLAELRDEINEALRPPEWFVVGLKVPPVTPGDINHWCLLNALAIMSACEGAGATCVVIKPWVLRVRCRGRTWRVFLEQDDCVLAAVHQIILHKLGVPCE